MTADSPGFIMRDVYLSDMHDDCVENDYLWNGLTENSLFDGCYSAISARTYASIAASNGSARVWEIRNNLFRLEAKEATYKPKKFGSPGHGGFFKRETDRPNHALKVSLHNNIFRADQDANPGNLGLDPSLIKSCSNNTVVWLGQGAYPDTLPSFFRSLPTSRCRIAPYPTGTRPTPSSTTVGGLGALGRST